MCTFFLKSILFWFLKSKKREGANPHRIILFESDAEKGEMFIMWSSELQNYTWSGASLPQYRKWDSARNSIKYSGQEFQEHLSHWEAHAPWTFNPESWRCFSIKAHGRNILVLLVSVADTLTTCLKIAFRALFSFKTASFLLQCPSDLAGTQFITSLEHHVSVLIINVPQGLP